MKKILKIVKWFLGAVLLLIVVALCFPTWTPKIKGENSINELKKVEINGTKLAVMIRGKNKDNPILICVHGGPCFTDIPLARKYQETLEENFTVVRYDQRGSGKSYELFKDYSDITVESSVDDLIALTKYIKEYLGQDQVILMGHSYGTYISTLAAAKAPELYRAYVGVGQMSNSQESELCNWKRCLEAAKEEGETADVEALEKLEKDIKDGKIFLPREYVGEYDFACRGVDVNEDYQNGMFWGTEYNLLDVIREVLALKKCQPILSQQVLGQSISDLVPKLDVPVYFIMGKYDGMTSPEAAEHYLEQLEDPKGKQMIIFDESAHFPQLEEHEKFNQWMCETFAGNNN